MAPTPAPLAFKTRVGKFPRFYVPRTGDTPPEATIALGDGPAVPMVVADSDDHPEFGARWQLTLPEPFWAPGDYRIAVSSGEVLEVAVGPHNGVIKPDEAKRLAQLPPDEHVAAIAAFVQTQES